jgi:hypothetical protein
MHSGAHSVPGRMPAVLDQSPIALHLLPARLLPPYAIGGTAMFRLIERLAAFKPRTIKSVEEDRKVRMTLLFLVVEPKSDAHT